MSGKSMPSDRWQHWCVPPIRWIQRHFIPSQSDDWTKVSYQPMLYTASFVTALALLIFGDVSALPEHPTIREDSPFGLFWIWIILALAAPPMALGSLWLIQNGNGSQRYRGKWLRLAADIFQFTVMTIYLILRLYWGDYHIMPIGVFAAATLFVAHLIMRDVKDLVRNEQLAIRIHNGHGVQ